MLIERLYTPKWQDLEASDIANLLILLASAMGIEPTTL
jgi:hypothetical protein